MLDTATKGNRMDATLFAGGSGHRADPAATIGTALSGPLCSHGLEPGSAIAIPWYVVRHRPFVGKAVADRARELGFEARHFREERRRSGRDDWFEPVFPGYLFVQLDLSERSWGRILRERGVLGILGTAAGRPLPVPDNRMDELLNEFDERGEKRLPLATRAPRTRVGATLQVTGGPWVDFIGVCQASAPDRVKLLFNIFGRETPVTVPANQVREIDSVAAERSRARV